MKDRDIFDLENTKDLSANMKASIARGVYNDMKDSNLLLSLFDIKSPLTISEMMVGLYRKYNLEKPRKWMHCTLMNLKLYKKVKTIEGERGVYIKIKETNEQLKTRIHKCPPPAP